MMPCLVDNAATLLDCSQRWWCRQSVEDNVGHIQPELDCSFRGVEHVPLNRRGIVYVDGIFDTLQCP